MGDKAATVLALYRNHSKYYWRSVDPCAIGETGHIAMPIGGAGNIHSANKKKCENFFIRLASPLSGVRIVVPTVLAQHKGHERVKCRELFAALHPLFRN